MCILHTAAYRFFPLLILFCVVLVSVLGRDFGPMLTAERRVTAPPSTKGQGDQEAVTELKKEDTPSEQKEAADDFTGEVSIHPKSFHKVLVSVNYSSLIVEGVFPSREAQDMQF